MSKKRIQKKRQKLSSQFMPNTQLPQAKKVSKDLTNYDILNSLIECNGDCGQPFKPSGKNMDDFALIDWYVDNLPTLPYVLEQIINFLFSNGLTTGDETLDETVLKPFLFSHNIQGITNFSVIQEAIKQAMIYGKCGLRWLSEEDGMISMNYKTYTSVIAPDKEYLGFNKTVFYLVSTDPTKPVSAGPNPVKFDAEYFKRTGQIVTEDRTMFILTPDEMTNFRNDTSKPNGQSKLLKDKQRLNLLARVYERLNYDIEYDGPGRLIFWLKDNFLGNDVDLSAGELLNMTPMAKSERQAKAKAEIEAMAQQIKHSSSDNTIAVSSMFDKMEHLPRVTKATEFLEFLIMKEGSIIAQCFGIVPELIGLGDVSGNVSMEKIIDNAMTNTIVPMREVFATQLSPMLSAKLGIPKLYFDKYELKQFLDKSAQAYKMGLTLTQVVGGIANGQEFLEDSTIKEMEGLISMICDAMQQYI